MRVVFVYKNFAAQAGISHIGLGVSALNTCKVLRREGIEAEIWPISQPADLQKRLASGPPPTHVIVSAPWIPTLALAGLANQYPNLQLAVVCHSNVGFLQADSDGVRLVRESIGLERGTWNFHLAGNSERFCSWISHAYSAPCAYLPNLYYLDGFQPLPHGNPHGGSRGTLRIGIFGATRPLKNMMAAVAAALEIGASLRTRIEIHVSVGRAEGGGDTIMRAVRAMTVGLPAATLVEDGWRAWPQFRELVRSMHLLLQPSYTESFNMVTADGVAEGVPSVVSEAIDWAPKHWQACVDDALDIARVGRLLLSDHHAVHDGRKALTGHNQAGLRAWKEYLGA